MKRWMLCFLLLSTAVRAEFFIDLFGGYTYVQDGSFTATENREIEIPGGELTSQGDLSGSGSGMLGLRGGYWIGAKKLQWLGVAVDLNGFRADAQDTDVDVLIASSSLMLMVRYPLMMTEEYSHGRFQPYAGIGAMRAVIDIDGPTEMAQGTADSDLSGVFCTGAKWMFTSHFGLFAEYRIIYITFDHYETDSNPDFFGGPHTRVFEAEGDITAHQFISGLSYHF